MNLIQLLRKKVKKNLRNVPVTSVKVGKDGNGIINFPDPTTRDNSLTNLVENFNAQANDRPSRTLLPKLTIFNLKGATIKSLIPKS